MVDVPVDVQWHRASRRDGQTTEQIQAIIAKQIDRPTRLSLADDMVDNAGDLTALYRQLDELHKYYLTLSSQS